MKLNFLYFFYFLFFSLHAASSHLEEEKVKVLIKRANDYCFKNGFIEDICLFYMHEKHIRKSHDFRYELVVNEEHIRKVHNLRYALIAAVLLGEQEEIKKLAIKLFETDYKLNENFGSYKKIRRREEQKKGKEYTLFRLAVLSRDPIKILEYLSEKSSKFFLEDYTQPLIEALKRKKFFLVDWITEKHPIFISHALYGEQKYTFFHLFIKALEKDNTYFEYLKKYLEKEPEHLNWPNQKNQTPFWKAASNGNIKVIHWFLDSYVEQISLNSVNGMYTIYAAVDEGHAGVAFYLFEFWLDWWDKKRKSADEFTREVLNLKKRVFLNPLEEFEEGWTLLHLCIFKIAPLLILAEEPHRQNYPLIWKNIFQYLEIIKLIETIEKDQEKLQDCFSNFFTKKELLDTFVKKYLEDYPLIRLHFLDALRNLEFLLKEKAADMKIRENLSHALKVILKLFEEALREKHLSVGPEVNSIFTHSLAKKKIEPKMNQISKNSFLQFQEAAGEVNENKTNLEKKERRKIVVCSKVNEVH